MLPLFRDSFPLRALVAAFCFFSVAWGQTAFDPEPAPDAPAAGSVQVWVTTADASQKLARQANLNWTTQAAAATNITVNEAVKFQQIEGFGASILDSSLWNADPAVRDEVMRLLFSRSSGIGLSMIRVPIGSTSLNGAFTTHNDLPAGQTDPTLAAFSIAGDEVWKLPMMQEAKRLNPELALMGTPWSAPAWMKTSGSLGFGKLRPEFYATYAQYFRKWLDEWRARGLGISMVTIQNEPQHEPYWYQGMRMEASEQAAFALELGPALRNAGHATQILCWDHNADQMSFPIAVMDDPVARNWIQGAAFHAYAGTTSDIYQFTDEHPDKDVYFTEQTGSYPANGFGGSLAWHMRNIFLVPSLNGARSNLVWQLTRRMEDTLGGDRPFVRITPDGKGYELHGEYYETGHFSKFVRRGARRIETNNPRDAVTRFFNGPLLYAAYQNPDGSKVLVVLNESGSTQNFTVEDLDSPGRRIAHSLAGGAVATFFWRDVTGGTGLTATYFDNSDFTGTRETRIDPQVDFNWLPATFDATANFTFSAQSPIYSIGPAGFSARWEGTVLPASTGLHSFHVTNNDGVRLWVNGQLLIDRWQSAAETDSSGSITLTANQPATITLEYFSSRAEGGGRAALAWTPPGSAREVIPRSRLYPVINQAVPPPPLGLSARAPGSSVQLAWSAAPGAASYRILRATGTGGNFTAIAEGITATGFTDSSVVAGTSYLYRVAAVNAQGEGPASAPARITPRGSSLSSPWQQQDIGSVGTAGVGGNAGDNGEKITLGGAGSDIWNAADSFRFAWLPLTGDGTIVARVVSQETTSGWAKAGLMIRESLNANSAYVNIVVTPSNGIAVQSRAGTGASATGTTVAGLFAPRWLKLTRTGSTFTGYHSLDGVNWIQTAAPVTVSMGANVHIGLAVCSGNTSRVNLVEFDGISAPGLARPRPSTPLWLQADPGNASVNLSWSPSAYATNYELLRATSQNGTATPIATISGTSFTDDSAANDTTYFYSVRGVNATGAGELSPQAAATPRASFLPAGWLNRDIGTMGPSSEISLNSGVYTIQAAGAGVWNTADGFNFSYRPVFGDGSMTVRVDSLTNVNSSATKAGIMFRASGASNSAYAYIAITPGTGVKFEYRSATGVSAASQGSAAGTVPRWVRLEKAGGILRAFASTNGTTWTQIGADLSLPLGTDFLAGIAVTANSTTTRTTAVLSQFSSTGFGGPLTPANLTAIAGLDGVRLSWNAVATATSYRIKRMAAGDSGYTLLAEVASPGFWDSTVANRTTYSYIVTAVNSEGEGGATDPVTVSTNLTPVTSAWSSIDVGSVGIPGNADHSAGTFTIRGSGNSISGTADSLHACAITLSGAITFQARVANVGNASATAKVGIMVRESAAANSRFAYIGISPNGTMEYRYRTSAGGSVTTGATSANQSLPRYLRLTITRSNKRSTFSAFHSANGMTWTQLGSSFNVNNMASSILGALVVCSMDNTKLHTATFDQVSATGQTTVGTPAGVAATGTPTSIDLAWTATPGASSYRIKRSITPGGPYLTIAQTTNPAYSDTSVPNHTTHYYVVTAVNGFGESAASAEVNEMRDTVTLPPNWSSATTGSPGLRGSSDYAGRVFTIRGSGGGIGGTADAFHSAFQNASGDGQLTARIASFNAVGAGARAGLMFRDSTAPGAPYVMIAVTPAAGLRWEYRSTAGAASVLAATESGAAPVWLRLVRNNNTFTAFASADGSAWNQIGAPVVASLSTNALAGLVSTSGDPALLQIVNFENVSAPLAFDAPLAVSGLAYSRSPAFTLNWDAVPGATSYTVSRAPAAGGPWTVIASGIAGTSFADPDAASLPANSTFYYTVTASNQFGDSGAGAPLAAIPAPPAFRVLVLGNTRALHASEAAFPPGGVADELRQILNSDPAFSDVSVTVSATDLFQSKSYTQTFTQTLQSRSLMSGYYWPLTRSTVSALLAQNWDHVVMIEDPFVASRFPEYSFEGVRAIARDVRAAGGNPLLLMTWTSAASPGIANNTARFAEMAYRVGAATGVTVVPAGYAWANLAAEVKGTGTRPNVQGNYASAAAIYSQITGRNASTASHVPSGVSQADRNTIATAARDAVIAAPGQTHFTGQYRGPTSFASPLLKKRSFKYTDFNSSTETGIRNALGAILAIARMDWTQNFAGYQSLPTSGFPFDFAQTRDYLDADPTKWTKFGTFDFQDTSGAESMIAGVDRVMFAAPLPEQETSASAITAARIEAGTFFVPMRVLWTRMADEHPSISAQPDGHHLSEPYNHGMASMMFTLLTGRCGVGSQPDPANVTEWRNWAGRKTGYEIAWQYATLRERVPGFEVLPASAGATTVTPGNSTTMSVRFLYAPTANVTVSAVIDNAAAATVSPATLTFTPQNYSTPQTVTITGLPGAQASDNFVVSFSSTSADSVFHLLADEWGYATLRPAAGVWTANASGLWSDAANWSGGAVANGTGSADFSTIDITADRTVSLDAALSVGGLVFGDSNSASGGSWLVNNNGNAANILTLAGAVPTITVNSLAAGRNATISAAIAGSAGLVKAGPGTLVLSGINTFTGNTTVNAGTLQLNNGGSVGVLRGTLTINPGATVHSSSASSFGWGLGTKIDALVMNNGTLTHNPAGGTLTLSSVSITLAGSTMNATGSAGFDFFDASAIGGPNLNTSLSTLSSSVPSVLAGRVNLRAGNNDTTGTVFTVADGAAAEDLVVSAVLADGSAQGTASVIQKSGAGRMVLSGANSYTGGTILNGGSLVVAHPTALGSNSTIRFNAGSGLVLELATPDGTLTNNYTIDMGSNRFNSVLVNRPSPGAANYQIGTLMLGASTMTFNLGANISGAGVVRIGVLDLAAGNNDRPVIVNGNATLQVGSAAILSNPNVSKRLQLDGTSVENSIGSISNGAGTGILSLIKAGAGRWTLTGNNTYSGTTSIQAGELVLQRPTLPDSNSLSISSGALLNLDFSGTDIVGSLVLNGVTQPPGTYGSLTSAATNRTSLIAGNGTITVLSAAYQSWAGAAGLGAAAEARAPAADPDGDGVANLLEWVLGGDPLVSQTAILPALQTESQGYGFSFQRNTSTTGAVSLVLEWSTNLISWSQVPIGAVSSGPNASGITVSVTPASGAPDSIRVHIPASNAPGGVLFTRLKANQ